MVMKMVKKLSSGQLAKRVANATSVTGCMGGSDASAYLGDVRLSTSSRSNYAYIPPYEGDYKLNRKLLKAARPGDRLVIYENWSGAEPCENAEPWVKTQGGDWAVGC